MEIFYMYFQCLFLYLFWVKSHLLVIDNKIIDVACMRVALSIIVAGVIMIEREKNRIYI
jgi:hypothetical protein